MVVRKDPCCQPATKRISEMPIGGFFVPQLGSLDLYMRCGSPTAPPAGQMAVFSFSYNVVQYWSDASYYPVNAEAVIK